MRLIIDEKNPYGYFWVRQLPPNYVGENRTRDRLSGLRGYWRLEAKTITDLFVGGGEVALAGRDMVQAFSRRSGDLVVPGSTIKGTARVFLEALSPSCLAVDSVGRSPCKKCPACCIFGVLGAAGWARFGDGIVSGKPVPRTIDHRTEARRSGPANEQDIFRKFYARDYADYVLAQRNQHERIEALTEGRFTTTLSFDGLEPWELGLFQLALGVEPGCEFDLKMGGAKNRGLGVVRFRLVEAAFAPSRDWLLGVRNTADDAAREAWREAYRDKATTWQMTTHVAEIARYFREEYGHGA